MRVSRGVRRGFFPLFHEEVPAEELKVRVGAARRAGVRLAEQVLGRDRKGGDAVRAEKEEHRVGEGVQGEVGPVFRGGSRLARRSW